MSKLSRRARKIVGGPVTLKNPAVLGGLAGTALAPVLGPAGTVLGGYLGSALGHKPGSPGAPSLPDISEDLTKIDKEKQNQAEINKINLTNQRQLFDEFLGKEKTLGEQFMTDTQKRYADQQGQLKGVLDKFRQNAAQQLTTGQEGEALRQQYNRLGLLNSGAFNEALARQFSDVERGSEEDLLMQGLRGTDVEQGVGRDIYGQMGGLETGELGSLSDIISGGARTQSELGIGGLQRRFGLEDLQYQSDFAKYMAKKRRKQELLDSLIGLGGELGGGYLAGR